MYLKTLSPRVWAILLLVAAASGVRAATPVTLWVSAATGGALTWATPRDLRTSADGRFVAFISNATDIAAGANGKFQVFVQDRQTNSTELISRSASGAAGDQDCHYLAISSDGRYVAFASNANNLFPGFFNGNVYLRDRQANTLEVISVSANGGQPGNWSGPGLSISPNGRYVTFVSPAGDLVANDFNGVRDVFIRDRQLNVTELVSRSTSGDLANGDSGDRGAVVSADGRYVVFASWATNLAGVDTNGQVDIYRRDRLSSVTTRVSLAANGSQPADSCLDPTISSDARYVAFHCVAELVPGLQGVGGVYVRDTTLGTTTHVSVLPNGTPSGAHSHGMTPDGRYVAFTAHQGQDLIFLRNLLTNSTETVTLSSGGGAPDGYSGGYAAQLSSDARLVFFSSQASNLVAGDTNGRQDLFVRDRTLATNTRLGMRQNGQQASTGALSTRPAISSNGRFVAFVSDAHSLVLNDTNATNDVFLWDRITRAIERVNVSTSETEAVRTVYDEMLSTPAVSADGRYVAFVSGAGNLTADDFNPGRDVFVRDRLAGITERVSIPTGGALSFGFSGDQGVSISDDGRFVAFSSNSTDLVPNDSNSVPDVFVRDRLQGTTERVSLTAAGGQSNGNLGFYDYPRLSADGRYVGFVSSGTNLVPGDTNNMPDAFVRDRVSNTTHRVSVGQNGAQGNSEVVSVSLSGDARFVAFDSWSSNLVNGDTNGWIDVFVRDRTLATTERVSVRNGGTEAAEGGFFAAISGDGRFVAFESHTDDLALPPRFGFSDVYVRDRIQGTTTRGFSAADGSVANGEEIGYFPALNGDGRFLAFTSSSTNLVTGETRVNEDVFLRDRVGPVGPPDPPSGLAATASSATSVQLTWADNSTIESGFEIERSTNGVNFQVIATPAQNATSYLDDTVVAATTYHYRLRALGVDGNSSFTPGVQVTTGELPPTAPTSLTASAVVPREVALSWTDQSGNEDGFHLQRSPDGSSYGNIAVLGSNVTSHSDTSVAADSTYYYRVRAFRGQLNSPFSNAVSVTTLPEPPAAPTALTASNVTKHNVLVGWADQSDNETGFRIHRSIGAGAFVVIGEVPGGQTSFQDTGHQPDTLLRFRVYAFNVAGSSEEGETLTVRTLPDAPTPPSSPLLTVVSESQIDLSWTNGLRHTQLRVERDSGTGFQVVATLAATATSQQDTGLLPSRTYAYRVTAVNDGGVTSGSSASAKTAPAPAGKLKAPKILNFGTVRQGNSAVKNLLIHNISRTESLRVGVNATQAPFSGVSAGTSRLIPPRGYAVLTITFTPVARAVSSQMLTITSSDPVHPAARLKLQGRGK